MILSLVIASFEVRGVKPLVLAALALLSIACTSPTKELPTQSPKWLEREADLSGYFAGIDPKDATFVVYHPASGQFTRYNPERAQQRFLPASTYKIPNSLIAIETGVAKGLDHLIPWDGTVPQGSGFWSPAWSRDHTLRSAMQTSAYWYYQEIAHQIGDSRMQSYLDQFEYGNRSMGGGLDKFWLHGGGLRISPNEQVQFLERMYNGKLGLGERTTLLVREMLVLEDTPHYRISGKTGTADVTPTRELAWLVGYVEHGGDVWFYALNMQGEQVWEQWGKPAARLGLVRSMLRELNVIPGES